MLYFILSLLLGTTLHAKSSSVLVDRTVITVVDKTYSLTECISLINLWNALTPWKLRKIDKSFMPVYLTKNQNPEDYIKNLKDPSLTLLNLLLMNQDAEDLGVFLLPNAQKTKWAATLNTSKIPWTTEELQIIYRGKEFKQKYGSIEKNSRLYHKVWYWHEISSSKS